jgi:hypothetical protein
MATYHVAAVPIPGESVDRRTCPLGPRDVTADSVEDALALAKSLMMEAANEGRDPADYKIVNRGPWRVVGPCCMDQLDGRSST